MGAPLHGPGPPGGHDRANIPEDRLERKKSQAGQAGSISACSTSVVRRFLTNPTTPPFAGTAFGRSPKTRCSRKWGSPGKGDGAPPEWKGGGEGKRVSLRGGRLL